MLTTSLLVPAGCERDDVYKPWGSCGAGLRRIDIVLPALPEGWEEVTGGCEFEVFFPGRDGFRTGVIVPEGERRYTVRACPGDLVPFVAEPRGIFEWAQSCVAGALYPEDIDASGTLVLSWERGFIARLAADLYREGIDPAGFNMEKLDREIALKCGDDRRRVDRSLLTATMRAGELGSSSIRKLPEVSVRLPLPAGEWLVIDPIRPRVIRAGPEGALVSRVYRGSFLFVARGIPGFSPRTAELYIDRSSWYLVIRNLGFARSGSL